MKFGSDDAADRKDSARWLGDLLSTTHLSCAVVMGDFNAEPYESPFNQTGLRAVRFFSTTLWSQATPAYLYNTAWRFLPEPDYWESASQPGYRVPRPRGSFDSSPPVIFDQIMVSGRALRNGPITLVEDSVYYYTDPPAATQPNLKPQRWDSNSFVGASDHLPLVAKFTIS